MAPVNFEDQIKESLNKREIQPSTDSWERLNNMLEKNSRPSKIKWWYSAAIAVLVVGIGSLLIFERGISPVNEIAEEPVIESGQDPETNTLNNVPSPRMVNQDAKTEISDGEETIFASSNSEKSMNQPESVADNSVLGERKTHDRVQPVVLASHIQENYILEEKEMINSLGPILAAEKTEAQISDSEIDALLMNAAKEITMERTSQRKVSSEMLLTAVEEEIDHSFRQEVFEILKEGFLKARTAIATRNQ